LRHLVLEQSLFILAYLSSKDISSGYSPMMFMGIGLAAAVVAIAAAPSKWQTSPEA
jgi:hypothetical protein